MYGAVAPSRESQPSRDIGSEKATKKRNAGIAAETPASQRHTEKPKERLSLKVQCAQVHAGENLNFGDFQTACHFYARPFLLSCSS